MADGYVDNLSPVSSEPSTLKTTSESEGRLSQHIANSIGDHDLPNAGALHEAPATNSNCYSNPRIEDPSSQVVHQRHCNETPWNSEEPMEKESLPTCGNSDILDFAVDELSTLGTFPSSFATDLQDLKQDFGILAAACIEDYSDVSSCSDMASVLNSKPKTDVTTKPSSSESLHTITDDMIVPTESRCPNISETNQLQTSSNVMAEENLVECAQKEIESPEKNVTVYTGHNLSCTTSNMVTTTGSEFVEDKEYGGGEEKKENVKRDLYISEPVQENETGEGSEYFDGNQVEQMASTASSVVTTLNNEQAHSDKEYGGGEEKKENVKRDLYISEPVQENETGDGSEYLDGNQAEQMASTASSVVTTLNNEQAHSDENVLRKDTKQSLDYENDPITTDGQNMRDDDQNKNEFLMSEIRESFSLEKETSDKQTSPNPTSTDCQNENTKPDSQEKDTMSYTTHLSDVPSIKISDPNEATNQPMECLSGSTGDHSIETLATDQMKSLHESSVDMELEKHNGGVAENELHEKLDTLAERLGVLCGEPLSGECDADETKLGKTRYQSTLVAKPDSTLLNHSVGQVPQLKSSLQMQKLLQPVVILKSSETVNEVTDSYCCGACQHTTHNIDNLIEHHHSCHSVHDFQFCEKCNLCLMKSEQADKHVCCEFKDGPQFSSDSDIPQRGKRHKGHRCIRCSITFLKLPLYIKHMRSHTGKTPYKCNGCGMYFAQNGGLQRHQRNRCKRRKLPVTNPKEGFVQNNPYLTLPGCYIKLVDVSETHPSGLWAKKRSIADQVKKPLYSKRKKNSLQSCPKQSDKNNKCPLCPRLFKYSYNRARHLRICLRDSINADSGKDSGQYCCPLCHQTFTQSASRNRHIKAFCLRDCVNRLAKEAVIPKIGNEQIKQKESDQKKRASTALEAEGIYKCHLCPAIFYHSSGKYRHMKRHEMFRLTGKPFMYRKSVSSTMSKPDTLQSNGPKTEERDNTSKPVKATGYRSRLKLHKHQGERPYRCTECGKAFKRASHLIGHKNIHKKRIQCTVCRRILPTIRELIQHISSHPKGGKLRCPDCQLLFQKPKDFLSHLKTHKHTKDKTSQLEQRQPFKPGGPTMVQCSLCKENFNDAKALRTHCVTHLAPSSTQCPFCKRNFTSRCSLRNHLILHAGYKPFSCINCGKKFNRNMSLKNHRKKCEPKHLTSESVPQTPQTSHQHQTPQTSHQHRTPQTSHQHRTPQTSHQHQTPQTSHQLQCSFCPRFFCRKSRLENHHHFHKMKALYPCTRCGQCFGYTKITQHKNICNETRNPRTFTVVPPQLSFKCPHCPKRFRYRSYLLRHSSTHTGVQPYACKHCGHCFQSKSMRLKHEALCDGGTKERQSKVKDVAATRVSKVTTRKETAHKPQTEGEAEYKCKFCTKTFVKSRSLRRHILTHNEVKPYKCKACDSCFSRYDHLKVHQNRCKGKQTRLEICIPKISLDDVGMGWQKKFTIKPAAKQDTFECEECSRIFLTQSKLSRHVTMFHTKKLFKCSRCGSSYSHEKTLKQHRKICKSRKLSKQTNESVPLEASPLTGMRRKIMPRIQTYLTKELKYKCSSCPRAFQTNGQLIAHNRLHTGERPYVCGDCGLRFIRKDYVTRHLLKCHKKTSIIPPILSDSIVDQSQSASESHSKGFSCAYCSSRFLLFSQLQEHFLNAHKLETKVPPVSTAPLQHNLSNTPNVKEEPLDEDCDQLLDDGVAHNSFPCTDCNASFTNKAGLGSHRRTHASKPPHSCIKCRKGFWNKNHLRNHKRKCRFKCISEKSLTHQLEVPLKAEIGFVLDDSVSMLNNASTSTGSRVSQRNLSSRNELKKEFPINAEANQVQNSSSKEKTGVQYKCSECDESFTDGLMLMSHLEEHGRQEQAKKNNRCIQCEQVFATSGHLARHMRIHQTAELSCPDCSKTFSTLSDLEIHRMFHDPKMPFSCKVCKHKFLTRPSLVKHFREEHADDAFTCRLCTKAYPSKRSLERHYKSWHQKEPRNLHMSLHKSRTEQQSNSKERITGERDSGSEKDSDSDSAPYFPCHVCGKTFPTSESLEDHQRCHLGEKPHECAECGRCFFQASQLQQHQRMHKSEFQCQACGRGFVSLFAMRNHKHTHGKSRPYRCSKCDFSFTGPLQLAEHMSTHREENFPCDICNVAFPSKSSRAEHRKTHSNSGYNPPPSIPREEHEISLPESSSILSNVLKYRCGVCSECFRDPEELSEHGCMRAKERLYSCSDCNKHFLHESHLRKHRSTDQHLRSNNKYPCSQCNKRCYSSHQFLCHLKDHVDTDADVDLSPSFICPVCHQNFASATELVGHFPTHHDDAFQCKMCTMTFLSKSKLEEHKCCPMTSASECGCTECGQSFADRGALNQHHCSYQQQTTMAAGNQPSSKKSSPTNDKATGEEEEVDVTGEDLFNCPVCSMRFSSKSGLLEHQNNQHQNEKPFICKICGNTFAKALNLRRHERRTHNKNTIQSAKHKFKCSQCPIKVNTAEDLSLHMRLHTENEVEEFRCDMCNKSFSQWSQLVRHQESHVGQVVYECTECDKAFAFPDLLEEHQQTHVVSTQ